MGSGIGRVGRRVREGARRPRQLTFLARTPARRNRAVAWSDGRGFWTVRFTTTRVNGYGNAGGYTPACAAFSVLMSSFLMSVMAAMTLPAFSGSGSVSSPGRMVGATCHDTP
jgi:hypothetical protein